MWDEDFQ
jgi:hypothetical protein